LLRTAGGLSGPAAAGEEPFQIYILAGISEGAPGFLVCFYFLRNGEVRPQIQGDFRPTTGGGITRFVMAGAGLGVDEMEDDPATWADGLVSAADRFIDHLRKVDPECVGGPTQMTYVDNSGARWLRKPIDGVAGVRWRAGAGHKIGADGSAEVKTGPGATINGAGEVVPNLGVGTSVGLNPFNQLVVPNGSLGNANFGAGLEAYGIYFGAPTGGAYASAPNVIIDTSVSPWKVKRKNGSGGWTAATDPADIVAGTITALVAILSPSISGGSISGASISSVLNNVICEMNGTYDNQVGGYTGLRVRSAIAGNYRVVVVPGGVWMMDTNNVVRAQLLADGVARFYNAAGQLMISVDGASGQALLYDTNGVNRVWLDAFGGSGHIGVTGPAASITINGRAL
jgi:hypothetical protein